MTRFNEAELQQAVDGARADCPHAAIVPVAATPDEYAHGECWGCGKSFDRDEITHTHAEAAAVFEQLEKAEDV